MADIRLTDEQQAAVDNRGGCLLVSAAAGSGKTKVLVERLFSYITDENVGADLTDFLIITYTKAAAAELRAKIASEIAKRLGHDPGNRHLQKQSMLVYKADIKTVDAFCTQILRENVHRLGSEEGRVSLTPDFRVLDETEAAILREKAMNKALEEFYSDIKVGDGKTLLAEAVGAGRDDSGLEKLALEFYGKLQSHAYPERWLESQRKNWDENTGNVCDGPLGRFILDDAKNLAAAWKARFNEVLIELECDDKLMKACGRQFSAMSERLGEFVNAAEQGWDEAYKCNVEFPRYGSYRGDNEYKTYAKAQWDNCKKQWTKVCSRISADKATLEKEMETMTPAMLALFELTENFSKIYSADKLRRNVADFSDQEHLALRLLVDDEGKPTAAGKAISDRYIEIMVDEYQDTNEVQNSIFSAVSKDDKNVFMVGDVKQSIYRFRLADPTIFLGKYRRFPMYTNAVEGQERKLSLSANFRSRSEVLDATNFVFSNIMSVAGGEMNYGDEEKLNFGAKYYSEEDHRPVEFDIIDCASPSSDEDEDDMDRNTTEAMFIAGRIHNMIAEKFCVRDDSGEMRPARQEDFVILMRSPASKRLMYTGALEEYGLTCSSEASEDLFSTMEIAVMYSFLRIIDNPHQDVPLISVLRSPLFGFAPDRLAQIRAKTRQGDFYSALETDGGEDAESFIAGLSAIREIAPDYSVHRIIWHIYNKFNVLGIFGAMDGGADKKENLISLYEYARSFENSGFRGVFRFVGHLNRLIETGQQPAAPSAKSVGGVTLMSIHKSKGLEFPIVILADTDKRFNDADTKNSVLVHPNLGVGPMYLNREKRVKWSTVARDAISRKLELEMKAEEMRVLYVAMTRAKEKLIITASVNSAEKYLQKLIPQASCPAMPENVIACNSYAKWIMLTLLCRPECGKLFALADMRPATLCSEGVNWDVNVFENSGIGKMSFSSAAKNSEQEESTDLNVDIDAVKFSYPYKEEVSTPSKMTATQLKGRAIDVEIAENTIQPKLNISFAKPRFLEGQGKMSSTERGTAIHIVMQFLHFNMADSEDNIRAQIEDMRLRRLLTDEQAEAVDVLLILDLMRSPIGRELSVIPEDELHREYRFSVLVKAKNYVRGIISDDEIMLQGAVDCFFITEKGITVVDFKSDRIGKGGERDRALMYEAQLNAYSEALSRIFEKPISRRILYFFATGTAFEV